MYNSNNTLFGGESVCTNPSDLINIGGGDSYLMYPNATKSPLIKINLDGTVYATDINTLQTIIYQFRPVVEIKVKFPNTESSRLKLSASNYMDQSVVTITTKNSFFQGEAP